MPMGMTCPNEDSLNNFHEGRLPESEIVRIAEHLQSCGQCLEQLEKLHLSHSDTTVPPKPQTSKDNQRWNALIQLACNISLLKAPQSESPLSFGRYQVIRILGEGGMGTVYKAKDSQFQREVAVKVPHLTGSPERIELLNNRFLRETRTAAAVRHPHVCPVYDCGLEGNQPYLVMAYIPGLTLAEVLNKGQIPNLRDTLVLLMKITEGMEAIHKAGLIHRDLKPGNILLEQKSDQANGCQWLPYVTDFGLARSFEQDREDQTATGAIVGTPKYMAPEQVNADREAIGPATDIWAVGVITYEMLSGKNPFHAASSVEVLDKVRQLEPEPLQTLRPELPTELCKVIARCLQKNPRKRFANATELLQAWSQLLQSMDESGSRPTQSWKAEPSTTREKRSRGRKRQYLLLASVVLGLLAVILTIVFWPSEEGNSEQSVLLPTKGDLDIVIYESAKADADTFTAGNPLRQNIRLQDKFALPLTPRDWIRIEVTLDKPAYIYIIWIDTEGKATPIYPWKKYDWQQLPQEESPRREFNFPSEDGVGPLSEGAPGVETILLFARREPLTSEQSTTIAQKFPNQSRNSTIAKQPRFAVWLEQGERPQERTRGPIRPGIVAKMDDPELQARELMKHVEEIFPYSRAVLFGNTGTKR